MATQSPLILIVEDHFLLAAGMQALLEDVGLRTTMAASIEQALALIDVELPALAVVDLTLRREFDGMIVAKELSARGAKVIICTAYDGEFIPDLAVASYLRKPIQAEKLLAAIKSALAPE